MTRRKYRMGARADAVAQTRERIVRAAAALHAEQGVLSTGWDEIAERAGVAQATVYRHFPSLEELVPACARAVFDVARPPTIEEASTRFAGAASARERFDHLIAVSCQCFVKGEAWLHAARCERGLNATIESVVRMQEDSLAVLVQACLGDHRPGKRSMQVLCTLCDFPFWKLLVVQGMSHRAAEQTIRDLVGKVLEEEGVV